MTLQSSFQEFQDLLNQKIDLQGLSWQGKKEIMGNEKDPNIKQINTGQRLQQGTLRTFKTNCQKENDF